MKRSLKHANFMKMYRHDAWIEQGKVCKFCRTELSENELTADHLKARSNGGCDDKNNIACACFDCNQLKKSLSVNQFMKLIKGGEGATFEMRVQGTVRRINLAADRSAKRILQYAGVSV